MNPTQIFGENLYKQPVLQLRLVDRNKARIPEIDPDLLPALRNLWTVFFGKQVVEQNFINEPTKKMMNANGAWHYMSPETFLALVAKLRANKIDTVISLCSGRGFYEKILTYFGFRVYMFDMEPGNRIIQLNLQKGSVENLVHSIKQHVQNFDAATTIVSYFWPDYGGREGPGRVCHEIAKSLGTPELVGHEFCGVSPVLGYYLSTIFAKQLPQNKLEEELLLIACGGGAVGQQTLADIVQYHGKSHLLGNTQWEVDNISLYSYGGHFRTTFFERGQNGKIEFDDLEDIRKRYAIFSICAPYFAP